MAAGNRAEVVEIAAQGRRLPAVPGPLRLRALLHRTLGLLAGSARRKGVVLTLETAFDVPDMVVGDARALRRTLGDLVALAVRRVEQGHVVLEVGVASRNAREVMLRFTVTAVENGHRASTFAFRARFGSTEHAEGAAATGVRADETALASP